MEISQSESATRGGAEISGEAVNKVGKYAYSKLKKNTASMMMLNSGKMM